ncbi:nucleoside diphosphate kinase regulator [Ferrovibrio sp.]|uniref:nucleoside diphosphate kinase regulator n=1 Tax=Ferrovibrio sp. TaxID=1917215 RepID=UPI00311D3843
MTFLDPRPAILLSEPDSERLSALAARLRPRHPAVADMLDSEIGRAAIVASDCMPGDVATMRSHLLFGYAHSRRSHWLTLVYPAEADIDLAKLSVGTPVGAALIGLREGQTIAWHAASGVARSITLHRVVYQPERAGRYDL